jgi:hypothetical protein
MVIISFPNGADWSRANWIFRQLQKDVADSYPTDSEVVHELEKASAFGGLALESMEVVVRRRVMDAIKTIATATLQGKSYGPAAQNPNDEEGQRMYIESMRALLDVIERQADAVGGEPDLSA